MPAQGRRLETVLFLDMVGSTAVAARLGDATWREVLTRFNRIVRGQLKRFGGHEEDTAGDGFFATFAQPTQAVRCACAIAEGVRDLGLEIRAGLHTGETESIDGKRGGMAVVIGARVMSLGSAGEVLVTSTTKELVTGSGLEFEDLSAHELKGVPGTWQVFGVTRVDGNTLEAPLPADEAVRRFEAVEPPPFVKRRARWIAAAVVVLVAVVAGIYVSIRSSTPSIPAVADPITVLAVDPSTNAVGQVLRDGIQSLHRPGSIGYDGTNLWQSTSGTELTSGLLVRRDPATGEILGTNEVDTGDALGFGYGYAWAAFGRSSELDKIDPVSGQVIAKIELPGHLVDVDGNQREIWYLSAEGDLAEIDPLTAKVTHTYRIEAEDPSRVVPLLGDVWICDCPNGRILRFDPAVGKVTAKVELQQRSYIVGVDSADGNTLWLIDPEGATITPLDATTGEPGRPLGFGAEHVYDTQIGFGSIWVAAGSQLFRFDLPGGERHVIDMPEGASAGGLAMDPSDGIVWVENCGCPDQ